MYLPPFSHTAVLPILLMLSNPHRVLRLAMGFLSFAAQFYLAITLFSLSAGYLPSNWPDGLGVYLLGDWPAPFGIVAVVDRLSTIMLLLTSVLGAATWIYATARWDRAGVH